MVLILPSFLCSSGKPVFEMRLGAATGTGVCLDVGSTSWSSAVSVSALHTCLDQQTTLLSVLPVPQCPQYPSTRSPFSFSVSLPFRVIASTGVPPVCTGPPFQPTARRSTLSARSVLIVEGDLSVKMESLTSSSNVPLDIVSSSRLRCSPLNSSVRARSLVCSEINLLALPSTSLGSDTSFGRPGSVQIPSVSCPSFLVMYPRLLPTSRDTCRRCTRSTTLAVSSRLHGRLVTLSVWCRRIPVLTP